jgi:hypothetical protein
LKSDRLYIQTTCTNLKRELGDAVYDKKADNDLDSNQSDHALDALRYGLMEIAGDNLDAYTKEIQEMNESLTKDENEDDNLSSIQF